MSLPHEPHRPAGCPCCPALATPDALASIDTRRRLALKAAAGGALLAAGLGARPSLAADGPIEGDALVLVDGDGKPLTTADIQPGAKQVFAWPYDSAAGRARDGSRLNRALLIRVEPADLDPATQALAADGVVAYSGVCTHQGCDVSAYRANEKTLLCFCHFSQFQPAQGGSVVAGPAPRPLPALPLRTEGGRLVVAGPFTAPPGGAAA